MMPEDKPVTETPVDEPSNRRGDLSTISKADLIALTRQVVSILRRYPQPEGPPLSPTCGGEVEPEERD
jgi:hypothetical protein